MRRFSIITLMLLVSTLSMLAWDAVGHRVVAEVAYRNLNAKTRKQVDKVLGTKGMVYYASWADEIKSDTIYPQSYGWHFQNLKSGMSREELESLYHNKLAEGEHLFYALDSIASVLRSDKHNVDALKFVVHLVGDNFQPMHLGRPDDKGGNKVQMRWFNSGTNLHAVWDGKIIAYTHFSFQEYADFLQDRYGDKKKEVLKMTDEDCLWQTYQLQNEIYAYQQKNDNNTYHYAYNFREKQDWQLYIAGIRLAKLLNEIYK